MKIRVLAYTDASELGGAEISLRHLLAHLDPQIEVGLLGVNETVVAAIAAGRPDIHAQVVPPVRHKHSLRPIGAHVRAVRSFRPSIFHANLMSPWSCQYGISAALLARVPVVAVYQLAVPPVNRRQWILKRLTAAGVTAHVGVGRRTAGEVEQVVGLPSGSLEVVHNGVPDIPPLPPRRQDGRPTIGTVGRLEPQKGFDVLLHSLREIPDAQVVVVGDGSERPRLEKLAAEVGVESRVRWEGWSNEPRRLLTSFDVFALPSRFEGFPLAVLEAQLAGLPVVASDVGSVGEAVIPGRTGLLVPPDDPSSLAAALQQLLDDGDVRHRLGQEGRMLVLERFTATHTARGFEALYKRLLT
jgi:glycosyltransferase involved in cell wall biosynthesis